jgi:uncharacterized membrane protein
MNAESWLRLLSALLSLSYPLMAHLAVAYDSVPLTLFALGTLCFVILAPALLRGRWPAWLCVPVVVLLCTWTARSNLSVLPLFLPPVLVPAFMAWVFGHTLTRDSVPLIERLIRLLHRDDAEIDPVVFVYARKLTRAWTLLFASIATINFGLATIARPDGLLLAGGLTPPFTVPLEAWSIFANLMDPLLIASFFLLEYAYRRLRFPEQPYRNFFDFLRRVVAISPRLMESFYRK